MNHDDLDRLLGDALDARARSAVPDGLTPPPPRFAQSPAAPAARRRRRWVAPLAAAAAVVAAAGIAVGVTRGGDGGVASPPAASPAAPGAQPVHVRLLNSDGQTYGVGMPVIAYFSRRITDGRAFQAATSVTVDGKRLPAAWYFEPSSAGHGPLEAHLRPENFWPAHASVHVSIAARGLAAGKGLGFDNSLTLDFRTGAKTVIRVDGATHRLTVTRDDEPISHCAVSLGAPKTPTSNGVKVIMEKVAATRLRGTSRSGDGDPQYRDVVHYVQRLTYGGEYLLAAPWNRYVTEGKDASAGSTNLTTAAARKLYRLTRIGDVVSFVNTGGPQMQLGAGYGDWNVAWGTWLTGGAVPTH